MCRYLFPSYVSPYVQVSLSDLCVSVRVGVPFWAMCLGTCRYPFRSCVSQYAQVSLSEPRVSVRADTPFWATCLRTCGYPFLSRVSHTYRYFFLSFLNYVSVRAGIPLLANSSFHLQVFNLSEPRRVTRSHHERVRELGWPADLAPPLERLCSVCKDIESWLSEDSHRIAVIHARWDKCLNP